MENDDAEGVTWYFAGDAEINATSTTKYIKLPSNLVLPKNSDREIEELPDDITPPFVDNYSVHWQYHKRSGTIVISYPRLEQSESERNSPTENKYEHVSQGAGGGNYAINPVDGDGKISGWTVRIPTKFFPDEYEGPNPAHQPVDDKAALRVDGKAWIVYHEEMNANRPYSCYCLRRNGEVASFVSNAIEAEDELVVLQDGFQQGATDNVEQIIKDEFSDDDGGPHTPQFM